MPGSHRCSVDLPNASGDQVPLRGQRQPRVGDNDDPPLRIPSLERAARGGRASQGPAPPRHAGCSAVVGLAIRPPDPRNPTGLHQRRAEMTSEVGAALVAAARRLPVQRKAAPGGGPPFGTEATRTTRGRAPAPHPGSPGWTKKQTPRRAAMSAGRQDRSPWKPPRCDRRRFRTPRGRRRRSAAIGPQGFHAAKAAPTTTAGRGSYVPFARLARPAEDTTPDISADHAGIRRRVSDGGPRSSAVGRFRRLVNVESGARRRRPSGADRLSRCARTPLHAGRKAGRGTFRHKLARLLCEANS